MQLCTRTIWLDDGRIRMDGEPIEVVRAYEYEMHEAIARDQGRMVDQAAQSADLGVSNETPERASMGAVSNTLNDANLTTPLSAVAADSLAPRLDSSTAVALDLDTRAQSGSRETKLVT